MTQCRGPVTRPVRVMRPFRLERDLQFEALPPIESATAGGQGSRRITWGDGALAVLTTSTLDDSRRPMQLTLLAPDGRVIADAVDISQTMPRLSAADLVWTGENWAVAWVEMGAGFFAVRLRFMTGEGVAAPQTWELARVDTASEEIIDKITAAADPGGNGAVAVVWTESWQPKEEQRVTQTWHIAVGSNGQPRRPAIEIDVESPGHSLRLVSTAAGIGLAWIDSATMSESIIAQWFDADARPVAPAVQLPVRGQVSASRLQFGVSSGGPWLSWLGNRSGIEFPTVAIGSLGCPRRD